MKFEHRVNGYEADGGSWAQPHFFVLICLSLPMYLSSTMPHSHQLYSTYYREVLVLLNSRKDDLTPFKIPSDENPRSGYCSPTFLTSPNLFIFIFSHSAIFIMGPRVN